MTGSRWIGEEQGDQRELFPWPERAAERPGVPGESGGADKTVRVFSRCLPVLTNSVPLSSSDLDNPGSSAGSESIGAVVFDTAGRVLLVAPKGEYGGYSWTFPKITRKPNEAPADCADRAVREKGGSNAASIVDWVPGKHTATSSTTSEYALMISDGGLPKPIASKHVSAAIWATPVEAVSLISNTLTAAGQARDRAILWSAQCVLTFRLSIDSMVVGARNPDYLDEHWMDWFRLERPWGFPDNGNDITRAKLDAELEDACIYAKVEVKQLEHPISLMELVPPARTFSDTEVALLRKGMIDDRGLVLMERNRLCVFRSMSSLCAYEADFEQTPLGWRITKVQMGRAIYIEGPGSLAWESVLFEHIIVNLLLKTLDEALWLRFFTTDRQSG